MSPSTPSRRRARAAVPAASTAEHERLIADRTGAVPWKRFGPYLADRQWGTVREDYSASGDAWSFFPHDHARSRAYRWGEDGLLGWSDDAARMCFSFALWNGHDPILKERFFGLNGHEGNHGEDVKELYYHLDGTPTHSYMKALYKYPQRAFPYDALVTENARRGRDVPEFELLDTGVFADDAYFDVFIEYAKIDHDDLAVRCTVVNRGAEAADLHLLPTLWFRNTWSWNGRSARPEIVAGPVGGDHVRADATHPTLGTYRLYCEGAPDLLFTRNETDAARLWGGANASPYVKDAFDAYVVHGVREAVDPARRGTKAAAHVRLTLAAGATATLRLRLSPRELARPFAAFEKTFALRVQEADAFHAACDPYPSPPETRAVRRAALAGLLWSKQAYHFDVRRWLEGDPAGPPPPPERKTGRNARWGHLDVHDVLAMPDGWEYPWFAAWDLAFHVIPYATMDPDFAKQQLLAFTREWYLHPNGRIPAYEWSFDDVNPPIHAWAALRVYRIEKKTTGVGDSLFLERVFQKLLLNFTWWVNREDTTGRDVFSGGFLGLDNIGVFNRSETLPGGATLAQSDGTSWVAFYALSMLAIALELAPQKPAYEDIATKFFEHFLRIADAMNAVGDEAIGLWDDEDGFYYDVLRRPNGGSVKMRVRSLVGLVPLLAVQTIEPAVLEALPNFRSRLEWFVKHRPDLARNVSSMTAEGVGDRRLLSIVRPEKLARILGRLFDPAEFLAPGGIRSLSKVHAERPYVFEADGTRALVDYEPAESTSALYGGNSNWRGPIWFPLNYMLIEALQRFHYYLGDAYRVECPTGSGTMVTLWEAAGEISRRLIALFLRGEDGRRPCYGAEPIFQDDPHFRDLLLFNEYFDGETGRGLGATHQTGWTALVAKLIAQDAEYRGTGKNPLRAS